MISNGGSGDGPLALWPEWGVDSRQRDSNMMMLMLIMMAVVMLNGGGKIIHLLHFLINFQNAVLGGSVQMITILHRGGVGPNDYSIT